MRMYIGYSAWSNFVKGENFEAMNWFRPAKDGRDIPVYYRKAYKKARHKRKSERLAPGYWETFVKGGNF